MVKQHAAFFNFQPFIGNAVEFFVYGRGTFFKNFVFMDGDTGFGGMIDIHTHFSTLFAGNLIVRKLETGLFAAFYKAKALLFISGGYPEMSGCGYEYTFKQTDRD